MSAKGGLKASVDAGMYSGSGNQISLFIGSLGTILLSFLPNIKALTEADDTQLDVKAYFLKSIPLAVVQIFVGVFIFFGYPTKVAEKFSLFGRGMIDLWLDNTDPMALVKSIPDKFYLLQLSTDGSKISFDRNANKATREVFSAYAGNFSDMTADARANVSLQLESWVIDDLNAIDAKYTDDEQYKAAYTARISKGEADLTRIQDVTANDGTYTYAWQENVNSWDHGSALTGKEDEYIVLTATYTPVAKSNKSNASTTCVLNVTTNMASRGAGYIEVKLDSDGTSNYGLVGNGGSCTVVTADGTNVNATASVQGNKIRIVPVGSGDLTGAVQIINMGGVRYFYGTSNNSISRITLDAGSFNFTALKGTASWGWGESPDKETAETSEEDANTNTAPTGNGLGS